MRVAVRLAAGWAVAVAVLVAVHAADASSWPPTPAEVPYCNLSPKPIPPLSSASKAMNPSLELVNVFIRHGDRTDAGPNECWPNDGAVWGCDLQQLQHSTTAADVVGEERVGRAYRLHYVPGVEDEPGCAGVGQLTKRGYEQHITNGQHLRDAYINDAGLLPKTYTEDPGLFFLRADNSRRTQMSGQALFSGMYPEEATTGASNVFPFWTRDEAVDDILPNAYNCPLLTEASEAVLASPQAAEYAANVKATLERVSQQTGITFTQFGNLWDCLHTHICHSFPIPAGITSADWVTLSNLTAYHMRFSNGYNNSRVARLGMGPLVAEMYGNMKAILNGTEDPTRFWLYSGHDTGPILPLLSAYHVDYKHWCPYASLISVEMYKADTPTGHAVRFVYNGEVIVLDGCSSELCDFDEFKTITEDIIPSAAECGKPIQV